MLAYPSPQLAPGSAVVPGNELLQTRTDTAVALVGGAELQQNTRALLALVRVFAPGPQGWCGGSG